MEVVKNNEEKKEQPSKLTYEQLAEVLHQTQNEAAQMYNRMQQMNMANVFKRLDYLFKVVELNKSFSEKFVYACAQEIEEMLTVTEDNKEDTEKKED